MFYLNEQSHLFNLKSAVVCCCTNARDCMRAILNSPEGLDSRPWFSFCMLCFHVFIKQLKGWCYILWEWFNDTYWKYYAKTKTNWIFVHFWNLIDYRKVLHVIKIYLMLEKYNWCSLIIWSLVFFIYKLIGVIIILIW